MKKNINRKIKVSNFKLWLAKPLLSNAVQKLVFISMLLCLSLPSLAQYEPAVSNIHLIARPTPDSVMIRWAPGNYKYWDLGNTYGYKLERYTITKDSALLQEPVKMVLTPDGLKPWPMNDWEYLVKTNKYGGIAAQAIYGASFEVDAGEGTTPQSVSYKAREQKQRFSFALYAADISPEVARASGLWFTDHTAMKDEMYLYRIYFNLPEQMAELNDTAFVFTGIREYAPLPKPFEVSAEFGDKIAILSWNSFVHDNVYMAWEVERSINGKNFEPLNIDPQISVSPTDDQKQEYTYKYDSLPQNNKSYYYRVRGVSSFGERGPWSAITSGRGIEAIKASPNIYAHEFVKEYVALNWEFPAEMEGSITGFKVLRSGNHITGFEELKSKLKPSDRSFTDKKPMGTNYYKIMAYRDSTAQKLSYPYLVQLTDSIPPVAPKGLTGSADTLGIVTLRWNPNPDADIDGYRVFRSASGNDEYSLRTDHNVADTFYIDTISMINLNASVFYQIAAYDLRQNQSEFSAVLEVVKPDKIPPSLPVIKNIATTEQGIQITWINSTSIDVDRHELYRMVKGDTAWMKISEFPLKKDMPQSQYLDQESATNKTNRYKVIAIDKSGNISEPSLSIAMEGLRNNKKDGLQKIKKEVDLEKGRINLSWQLPQDTVKYIKVYRKTNETSYTLFETLDGTLTAFEDYGMKVGELYAYRIKLIYEDGSVSGFSDEIRIEF